MTDWAAPRGLELLRQFVNTRDIDADTDALGSDGECTGWLRAHDLLPDDQTMTAGDAERVRRVREALREALVANHDGSEMPPAARDELNDAIRRAGLSLRIESEGVKVRAAAAGADGAIGSVLVTMLEAVTSGIWGRLKVCSNDYCRWSFYDRSRSRARKWCSMSLCGNRAKQQTWRANRSTTARALLT